MRVEYIKKTYASFEELTKERQNAEIKNFIEKQYSSDFIYNELQFFAQDFIDNYKHENKEFCHIEERNNYSYDLDHGIARVNFYIDDIDAFLNKFHSDDKELIGLVRDETITVEISSSGKTDDFTTYNNINYNTASKKTIDIIEAAELRLIRNIKAWKRELNQSFLSDLQSEYKFLFSEEYAKDRLQDEEFLLSSEEIENFMQDENIKKQCYKEFKQEYALLLN